MSLANAIPVGRNGFCVILGVKVLGQNNYKNKLLKISNQYKLCKYVFHVLELESESAMDEEFIDCESTGTCGQEGGCMLVSPKFILTRVQTMHVCLIFLVFWAK